MKFERVERAGRHPGPALLSLVLVPWLAAGSATAQTLLWHFDDDCADLDVMGDVDGDGVNDVVVDAQLQYAVAILSGVDGHSITSYPIGPALSGFSVAGIGDIDGDGFLDLLVGDPFFQDSLWAPVGYVTAISGKDGSQLYHYQGVNLRASGYEHYVGCCVRGIGDGDGDGFSDFVYGVYLDPQIFGWGPSLVKGWHDRSNNSFAKDLTGSFDLFFNGHPHSLAAIGDVNHNGKDDFATSFIDTATGIGVVELRGGGSGNLIRSVSGTSAGEHFGVAIGSCGDLDGDGVRELLVGSTGSAEHGSDAGRVDVYSGATTSLLLQVFGDVPGRRFGVDVDGLDDVDGDGVPDFVVASNGTAGVADGRIDVFSGATGAVLMQIDDPVYRVRAVHDLNGDGIDDLVATPGTNSVHAWAIDLAPAVDSVNPSRIRYDHLATLSVHGRGFTADPGLAVLIDGVPATGVTVTSYTDLDCTPPALTPGPHDVTVTNQFGSATLAGGLLLTPAVLIDGTPTLGATIDVDYEFDALDSTFAIAGVPPPVSIPTPPFDGELGIWPFVPLFTLIAWPADEYVLTATIPNDPALVGVTFLLQSLTGPTLIGKGKDGAWTNVAAVTIQ